MTTRDQAQRVLAATAKSLEGVERPVLLKMLPILHKAEQEVERDFRAWLRGHHASDAFTQQRHRNAIVLLKRAIGRSGDLAGVTERALKSQSKGLLGPKSIENIQREWQQLGHIFEGSVQPLALDEAIIIARGDKLLWPQFEASAARYSGAVGKGVQQQLAVGMARSETMQELTDRLYKHYPRIWDGERWKAERLARNESMRAYGAYHELALAQAVKDDDKIRERIDGSRDGRRCPDCALLDGRVYEVGKGPPLPYHVCCRCIKTIWREGWPSYANQTSIETLSRAGLEAAA